MQNMPSNLQIGSYFKAKRQEALLSIDALSKATQISSELILKYESGEAQFHLEDIYAISNVLNIDPSDIMELFYTLVYQQSSEAHHKSKAE